MELKEALYYLSQLQCNSKIMQPEIREAIDFAFNELNKKKPQQED